MKKGLVIVESPTKVKTIKKYLGKDFDVRASVGHVKDLPRKRLGVDKDNDFAPEYEIIRGKGKIIKELKSAASKVDDIYLAPDPDREGEAIAWHIAEEIRRARGAKNKKFHRVLFHELTKQGILDAIRSPVELNQARFESQQARRILDRLVGYELSPLLWKKVKSGLSAGRVQSVAVRMICEREREIQAFKPEEYWTVTALLRGETPPEFEAKAISFKGEKLALKNSKDAERIVQEIKASNPVVEDVKVKKRRKNPFPPFITSTMQQDAARRLGFSAKKTMMLAQRLYEGVELGSEGPVGLITYMRTDSTRVAQEAAMEARGFVEQHYGKEYVPDRLPSYRKGKMAQDAHEAIRPTSVLRTPDAVKPYLGKDEARLYSLIWMRFVSSQMASAIYDQTRMDIRAGECMLRANGQVLRFPGFTAVYSEAEGDVSDRKKGDTILPALTLGDRLELLKVEPAQHFTKPPPRYSEASLIKALEEKGIGRPSTYASIISTIQSRDYVVLEQKRFKPTELGCIVTDLLTGHFPEIMDYQFTASLEKELDEIEEGAVSWVDTLHKFYDVFGKSLEKASQDMKSIKAEGIPAGIKCEKCNSEMVIKLGRAGEFLACSGYPECKNTKDFRKDENGNIVIQESHRDAGILCEKCGRPMLIKKGRFGEFLACSGYPECKNTKSIPTGVRCPRDGCDGWIVQKSSRKGKIFYGCDNYPDCDFAIWNKPVSESCPVCGADFLVEHISSSGNKTLKCHDKKCAYSAVPEKK
jgi:DNA topoisomerase-1